MTHNVKAMVLELKQSEEDVRKHFQVEEEEQNEAELKEKRIQRTKRGLEILAERGAQSAGCPLSLWAGRGWGAGRRGGRRGHRSQGLSFPAVSYSSCPVTAFWCGVNRLPFGSVAAETVVDPETTPYLDIANQTGRSIRIPPSERKVSTSEVYG